jgi:predicted small metal-binding protein
MAYTLACRDLGKDCGFVARGDSEDAVIAEAKKHLKMEHGYTGYQMEFPENIAWIKKAIKK